MNKKGNSSGGIGTVLAGGAAVLALIIFFPTLFIGQFAALPTILAFLKNPIILLLLVVAFIAWISKK